MKKKFICAVCGYIYEGTEAPEKCPHQKSAIYTLKRIKEIFPYMENIEYKVYDI